MEVWHSPYQEVNMRELQNNELHLVQGGLGLELMFGLYSGFTTGLGVVAVFLANQTALVQTATVFGFTIGVPALLLI